MTHSYAVSLELRVPQVSQEEMISCYSCCKFNGEARTPTLCHFLMTSFVTTGLGLHAAAQRVRLETQILNTQIWKRVTNDAGSVRELAPRISGANVRNNQANTGLQIVPDHFSSVWVKEEENRSQQWHVSCFMKDQLFWHATQGPSPTQASKDRPRFARCCWSRGSICLISI